MAVNTHGYKMIGLEDASKYTQDLSGDPEGGYVQISYDRQTGDILTNWHYGTAQNNFSNYRDPDVITICFTHDPMTTQGIADAIYNTINELSVMEEHCREGERIASLNQ